MVPNFRYATACSVKNPAMASDPDHDWPAPHFQVSPLGEKMGRGDAAEEAEREKPGGGTSLN